MSSMGVETGGLPESAVAPQAEAVEQVSPEMRELIDQSNDQLDSFEEAIKNALPSKDGEYSKFYNHVLKELRDKVAAFAASDSVYEAKAKKGKQGSFPFRVYESMLTKVTIKRGDKSIDVLDWDINLETFPSTTVGGLRIYKNPLRDKLKMITEMMEFLK